MRRPTRRHVAAAAVVAVMGGSLGGFVASLTGGNTIPRPDPRLTPGVADPAVTQDNIALTVCIPGYTLTVRNVPQSEKTAVAAEYGYKNPAPGSLEIDHLIPLVTGGANDRANLWAQPIAQARKDDVLEAQLGRDVCAGTLSLAEAQQTIVKYKQDHG